MLGNDDVNVISNSTTIAVFLCPCVCIEQLSIVIFLWAPCLILILFFIFSRSIRLYIWMDSCTHFSLLLLLVCMLLVICFNDFRLLFLLYTPLVAFLLAANRLFCCWCCIIVIFFIISYIVYIFFWNVLFGKEAGKRMEVRSVGREHCSHSFTYSLAHSRYFSSSSCNRHSFVRSFVR